MAIYLYINGKVCLDTFLPVFQLIFLPISQKNGTMIFRMRRKLFCEIAPWAYRLSVEKCILARKVRDKLRGMKFAMEKSSELLPVLVYKHNSLIRRKLGNSDLLLQENKAVNLAIAAPKINAVLIRPGETFSFWKLVGRDDVGHGYKVGLTIAHGKPASGVGGGLCQFTNLIHWMVLHSDLKIVEHHHHDGLDLFPDYHRQIPFGTGTSIFYNYLDYRFRNDSQNTYQLLTYTDGEYLHGELRALNALPYAYHVHSRDEHFARENGVVYRKGIVERQVIDKVTGRCLQCDVIRENHARVMYDTTHLEVLEDNVSAESLQ